MGGPLHGLILQLRWSGRNEHITRGMIPQLRYTYIQNFKPSSSMADLCTDFGDIPMADVDDLDELDKYLSLPLDCTSDPIA
ncbi:hypothetical protein H0H92_015588 [Tricholoma furcatifolium]|nr:hypothetical protein H0H92_015588 [Tricholoma furcatifolium]